MADDDEPPAAALSIAIPYFFLRLTTVCVERRDLGALKDFILRSISIGVDSIHSISGLLGVAEAEIASQTQELVDELFVTPDAAPLKLKLLDRGIRALMTDNLTRTVIRDAGCYVHGSTRRIEIAPGDLMPKRRLPHGCLPLPAVPTRPPRVDELDFPNVKLAILQNRNAMPRVLEVAKLGRIVRANALFKPGVLLLRRGVQALPQICIDGVADQELAQRYASHPALLQLKAVVARHDQLVKRTIIQHCPQLKGIKFIETSVIRNALSTYVAFSANENSTLAEQLLMNGTAPLVKRSAWVGLSEAQAAFGRALVSSRSEIVVACPATSESLFDVSAMDAILLALRRGVRVVLHTSATDERLAPNRVLGHLIEQGAKVETLPTSSEWCGFVCDGAFGVAGKTKSFATSIGGFDSFFGALITKPLDPTGLLKSLATGSGIPVAKRGKKLAQSSE
ncbi:hypothetical protein ACFPOE_08945 [Caenimonas terrae]|uniref:Uncharacterized protein n=1 Tax=Caenimonas terrae TaxID=696074 RepID=A0ABW0NCU0_9BURK